MLEAPDTPDARILIADDQPTNVKLLRLILDGAGYTCVDSTTDPREVCIRHRAKPYDLILLDLLMPGMYGFQVIEGLKEIEGHGDVPVLVVSAQPDYKLRAMQAGARGFIAKPIDNAELVAQVRGLLQEHLSNRKSDGKAREQAFQDRSATLRHSEELFHRFANGFPDALWVREGNSDLIRYINPAWEAITGQRLDAGDRTERLFSAIHPEDLARVRFDTGDLRSGGADLECRIVRPDATVRRVHIRTFLIRDAQEKIIQTAGIMQDINIPRRDRPLP